VVSSAPRPLYPRKNVRGAHWIGEWVVLGAGDEERKPLPCPRRELNLGTLTRSLVTILTELPRFPKDAE
jgi:hypothetical protein